jgi:uncharacterized membrane protein
MEILTLKTGGIKFVLGWIVVLLVRIIPFRPPNFEPMLAVVMPYSKRYGVLSAGLFGFLGIVVFDALSMKVGMWTWITAVSYGLLGVGAYFYFRHREANVKNFCVYGIIGTVLYDAVTGLSVGPLFFGQSLTEAFVGQVPFTLWHIAGTVVFSVLLSPALYRYVVNSEVLEFPRSFDPKRIF